MCLFEYISNWQCSNPCWNVKYMIHMGKAFRDTSLSKVWQLAASLRKKFGPPRPRSTVGGQSPDFSQTINSQTMPNYQHRVPATVAHWSLFHTGISTIFTWFGKSIELVVFVLSSSSIISFARREKLSFWVGAEPQMASASRVRWFIVGGAV